jgi:hypothetical protein
VTSIMKDMARRIPQPHAHVPNRAATPERPVVVFHRVRRATMLPRQSSVYLWDWRLWRQSHRYTLESATQRRHFPGGHASWVNVLVELGFCGVDPAQMNHEPDFPKGNLAHHYPSGPQPIGLLRMRDTSSYPSQVV